MIFLPSIVAVTIAAGAHAPRVTQADAGPVLVRRVLSGDTIEVAAVGRVRLLGIDAPTRIPVGGRIDTARRARERLEGLIQNRWVRLQVDEIGPGRHAGRTVRAAYVMMEEGTFVNALLVREGLARVKDNPRIARLPELQRAECEARVAARGIWSQVRPSLHHVC